MVGGDSPNPFKAKDSAIPLDSFIAIWDRDGDVIDDVVVLGDL